MPPLRADRGGDAAGVFSAWLEEAGISDAVELGLGEGGEAAGAGQEGMESGGGGRGVVARRAVAAGEAVFSVPAELLLNVDAALASPMGPALRAARAELAPRPRYVPRAPRPAPARGDAGRRVRLVREEGRGVSS